MKISLYIRILKDFRIKYYKTQLICKASHYSMKMEVTGSQLLSVELVNAG